MRPPFFYFCKQSTRCPHRRHDDAGIENSSRRSLHFPFDQVFRCVVWYCSGPVFCSRLVGAEENRLIPTTSKSIHWTVLSGSEILNRTTSPCLSSPYCPQKACLDVLSLPYYLVCTQNLCLFFKKNSWPGISPSALL